MKVYHTHITNQIVVVMEQKKVRTHRDNLKNSFIDLETKGLIVPESISAGILADMDSVVSNFKRGGVSPYIDLSDV